MALPDAHLVKQTELTTDGPMRSQDGCIVLFADDSLVRNGASDQEGVQSCRLGDAGLLPTVPPCEHNSLHVSVDSPDSRQTLGG